MFVAREPHTETITLSLDYGAALSPPGPLWSTRRLDTSTSLGRQAGVVRRTMEIFNRREGRRGVKKVPKDHASRLHSRHDPSGRYHPPPGAKGCNAKTVMSMYWTPLITVLSLTVESSTQKPQSGLSTALDDRMLNHTGSTGTPGLAELARGSYRTGSWQHYPDMKMPYRNMVKVSSRWCHSSLFWPPRADASGSWLHAPRTPQSRGAPRPFAPPYQSLSSTTWR